jgi:hypothetical protein
MGDQDNRDLQTGEIYVRSRQPRLRIIHGPTAALRCHMCLLRICIPLHPQKICIWEFSEAISRKTPANLPGTTISLHIPHRSAPCCIYSLGGAPPDFQQHMLAAPLGLPLALLDLQRNPPPCQSAPPPALLCLRSGGL